MEPFDFLNKGDILDFYLEPSNLNCFTFFHSRTPLFVQKNYSDYSVHGTQSDRFELRVLTQKLVWKNMHRVQRYWQKGKKFFTFYLKR